MGFNGLTIASTALDTTIRRLVINSFPLAGISVSANNVNIFGNRLGTDSTGTVAMPNINGLNVLSGSGLQVGSPAGTTPGGSCTGDCNLISGNSSYGIAMEGAASNATVQSNFLGANLAGDAALGNGFTGISTNGGSGLVVGGTGPGEGNVASGNGQNGVLVNGPSALVAGNIIGANSAGNAAIPNGSAGLRLQSVTNALIWNNVLSGNNGDGLDIFVSSNVQAKGNRIGVAGDGVTPLGNLGHGVRLGTGTPHDIGGPAAGDGNTIAFNGGAGVEVDGQSGLTRAAIRGNSIHSNTDMGIDNVTGGNTELPPPVILAAGSASGAACPNCLVDVYSDDEDEGRIYEGATTADGSGAWTFSGAVTGPFVTATATDASGNTSEFSAPFNTQPPTPTPTPSATPTPTPTTTATPTSTATPTPTPTPTATPTPTPSPTSTAGPDLTQGDVDCNGNVTSVDSLKELRFVAQMTYTQDEPCPDIGENVASVWGDVDCSGEVTSVDALKILRFVAGLSVSQAEPCADIGDLES